MIKVYNPEYLPSNPAVDALGNILEPGMLVSGYTMYDDLPEENALGMIIKLHQMECGDFDWNPKNTIFWFYTGVQQEYSLSSVRQLRNNFLKRVEYVCNKKNK